MVSIVVEATRQGINNVTKKLSEDVLFLKAHQSLTDVLEELERLVVSYTPSDTGRAQDSIFTEIHGSTLDDLEGIVASDEEYFVNLEYGRRAGARMPPAAPLERWAENHGIESRAVFAIRRAIAARGIRPLHMMERALKVGRTHFATIYFKRFLSGWGGRG
jgi:hypothetical protein